MAKFIIQISEVLLGYVALVGAALIVSHLLGVNLPRALIDFADIIWAQLSAL